MVLYFSGTGNSKYVARRIADALGDTLLSMNERIKMGNTSAVACGERLVIVAPTYAWRIPRIVRDWLLKTDLLLNIADIFDLSDCRTYCLMNIGCLTVDLAVD